MHEKILTEIQRPHEIGTFECRIFRFSDGSDPIVMLRDDISGTYSIFSEPEDRLMTRIISHAYATGYTAAESNQTLDRFDPERYSESPDIRISSNEYGAKYILAMGLIPEIQALIPAESGLDQGTIDFLEARFTHLLSQ